MNSFWRYENITKIRLKVENDLLVNIFDNLRILQKFIYKFTLRFSHNPLVHYKK